MNPRKYSRIGAASLHFLFSAIIVSSVLLSAHYFYYGGGLFKLASAEKIYSLIILVDIILGPIVTLLIYDADKPKLKQDLLLVASFQALAMLYGVYTLHSGRPSHIAFAVDRFELVRANEIFKENLPDISTGDISKSKIFGVKWVYAERPSDAEERNQLLFSALDGGPDLAQTAKYYKPLHLGFDTVLLASQPVKRLDKSFKNKQYSEIADGYSTGDLFYVPITSKKC